MEEGMNGTSICLVIGGEVVAEYTGAVPKVGDTIIVKESTEVIQEGKYTVDLASYEWRVVNHNLRCVFIKVTEVI